MKPVSRRDGGRHFVALLAITVAGAAERASGVEIEVGYAVAQPGDADAAAKDTLGPRAARPLSAKPAMPTFSRT